MARVGLAVTESRQNMMVLRPMAVRVGPAMIEVVPRVDVDAGRVHIDVNADVAESLVEGVEIGEIKIRSQIEMSIETLNGVLELTHRYNVIPRLQDLTDRANHMLGERSSLEEE